MYYNGRDNKVTNNMNNISNIRSSDLKEHKDINQSTVKWDLIEEHHQKGNIIHSTQEDYLLL